MTNEADRAMAAFGVEAGSYVSLLERCALQLSGYRYEFTSETDFLSQLDANISAAMRTYWLEIIQRSHWAASTSILRIHRWVQGALQAWSSGNLFAYAACSRGILEACADTNDALNPVPATLAEYAPILKASACGGAATACTGRATRGATAAFHSRSETSKQRRRSSGRSGSEIGR